ncbi:MAG: CsgG/HfaB family protein [Calditrichaceae bacterium]
MMKRLHYLVLFIFLVLFVNEVIGQVNIAVTDFRNQSDDYILDSWERSVPDLLRAELTHSDELIVLDRSRLESVLKEQALYLSGLIDTSQVRQAGQLLGAEFIISGTMHKINGVYRITADVIRVKTGQTKSESVDAPDRKHLQEMMELLGNNIRYMLTVTGNYMAKISLSPYPTWYFLGAAAGFGTAAVLANLAYLDNRDNYRDTNKLEKFDTYYDRADNARTLTYIFASLTGGALTGSLYCWLKNRSANEISAVKPGAVSLQPGFFIGKRDEVRFSVQIHF